MLKIWIKDEKTVRLKYLKPLKEERRRVMIKTLQMEIDVVVNQIIKENRPDYERLGDLNGFERKLDQTRNLLDNEINGKTLELQELIDRELNKSEKIEPEELVKRYGIDEPTLIDLRLIKPLQDH